MRDANLTVESVHSSALAKVGTAKKSAILIVEDNRDDALLIQRALRRANLINLLQVVAGRLCPLRAPEKAFRLNLFSS